MYTDLANLCTSNFKRMHRLFFLLLLPVVSLAQTPLKEFELKGKLNLSAPVDWVYLRYVSGDDARTDSVQPKDGEFKFKGNIAEPVVASIVAKFKDPASGEKLPREFNQLFLEPTKIELTANGSLKNISVKDSKSNEEFMALIKQGQAYTERFEKLYGEYDSLQQAGNKEGMSKIEKAVDQLNNEVKENVYAAFLKTHPDSKVALFAIKEYAGWDIDPEKVEPLFNSLPESITSLPSAKSLRERIDIAKKTAVGSYAMDFTQNDTLGKPVSLSSFKGKYVLVDFWASWCGPCRRENPNIVRVFNKFKDKNFTILGVSLDRPDAKDKWIAAIHKDSLTWAHVSDLKYWDNEVAKQYGIRAIPQNLLLDPQGKIIAKNLRGEDLDEKLTALIK